MFVALRRIAVVVILVAASSFVLAPSASAITATQTIPADGTRVPPPPTIRVVHDQGLNPVTSSIAVRNKDSATVTGSTSYATTFVPNDTIVFTPSAPLTEAFSDYSVTAVGAAVIGTDNTTTNFTFTVDTTPPDAPVVSAITNPVNASNQSAVATQGTAEPKSTVSVFIFDGTTGRLGQVQAHPQTGNFLVFIDVTPLVDGELTVDVSATDEAFNVSAVAHPGPLDKDASVPDAPTAVISDDPITSGNQAAITVSGTTTEDGLTIDVSVDDDNPNTPAVTGSDTSAGGTYSVPLDLTSLNQGTLTATATATDAAGNVSDEGTDTATKETGAPTFVSSSPVADATVAPPDTVTVTYDEALDPSSTITVVDGNTDPVPGTTTFADGGITIVFTPDAPFTSTGNPYTVTSVGKDGAANTETPPTSFDFTIDSTPPDAPEINSTDPDVRPSNVASFSVGGEAEESSTVEVTVTDESLNEVTGTTTANSPWDLDLDLSALDDGLLTITATATDAANNTSAPSAPVQVTKYWHEIPFAELDFTANGVFTPISGDFDGDGTADIFWYRPGPGSDYLVLSNGDGTYRASLQRANGYFTPIAGDYDGDGDTDIFWYRPGPSSDWLWLSNGDGTFSAFVNPVNGTYQPIVLDINGDTFDDIFMYRAGTAADLLLLSNGDGSFEYESFLIDGTYRPFTGDFDDDGADDIFWYAPGPAPDFILRDTGVSYEMVETQPASGTFIPIAGDYDADGDTDIFWYRPGPAQDYLWLSRGDLTFSTRVRPISGSFLPITGDYDADGDTDILLYAPGPWSDWLLLSQGDGTFKSIRVPQNAIAVPLEGDHDNDGDTDIFWYGPGSGPDELWLATLATAPPP